MTWAPLGARRFTDPFFEQTVAAAMRQPGPLLFQRTTPASALEAFTQDLPRPAGFIFHMSRCGSTLVTQMLAAIPHHRVISEAPLIDTVLGARLLDPSISHNQHLTWFRGMIHALGHGRAGERRAYFKFDCAHSIHLPFIREAFPDVPWIFLYRDPIEVLVSQHRLRGSQMIPGIMDPRRIGLTREDLHDLSFDEYGARVLASTCSAVLTFDGGKMPGGRLVNYHELPGIFWGKLASFFDVRPSEEELALMHEAATFSAKNPVIKHEDDTGQKKRAANEGLRALADRWLNGLYQQLELARLSQL